ncbi:apolipoprotein N-acyltransferase [Nocardioides jiangxiensis]|uniref:Apolipoprotein N-acyltransferase n=1 Tax=Nocardioides jiangxiensis TaxID=3064524 RepID=A0ABT9AXZ4_9ACTN|nr:apolipoprotein N-acyltransferase [Nocardioides sp. WY-20]MDO7866819.1 apolipoprotein N-acyltransferase [Nocardioides sp. WY-20]
MPTRLLVATTAGVVTALAFEPVTWAWLMPVGLAAYFLAARGATPTRAAAAGGAFGLAFFGTHLLWMRTLGNDAWVAITLLQAAFLVVLAVVLARLGTLRLWPAWYAVAWLAAETVRGHLPLGGFTWGDLGLGVIDTPVANWLPWIGVPGAGLVVACLGAGLAWLLTEGRGRGALVVIAGLVALLVLPAWVQPPRHGTGTATVALVQGDVPGDGTLVATHHYEVTRSHSDLTVRLANDVRAGRAPMPDFVVWPENSTAVDPEADPRVRRDISRALAHVGRPVLVGAISDDPRDRTRVINQGIVMDPATGPGETYVKAHPVPFGEFVPWRGVFGTRFTEDLGLVRRDMEAGTRRTPLTIAGTEVADAICFDVAFSQPLADEVRRGARMVVVQTSNATFINTRQIDQQFAITRVRAKELGRDVAVASTNGRTGFIDADGDLVDTAQTRTRDVLVQPVQLYDSRPPSLWVGPVLGPVAVALTLLGLAFTSRAYRRRREQRRTQ